MKSPIFASEFLLPKNGTDMNKWAVVACDQHTSNKEYWETLKDYVGSDYSALNLILPEIYLKSSDVNLRVENINSSMNRYLSENIFNNFCGMVLVKRTQSNGLIRTGLVAKVDLESYSYIESDKALIRASEGTVLERLPPRVNVRQKCSMELPHILLLIDDKNAGIIEPLNDLNFPVIYDFELNMGGGKIEGRFIDEKNCKPIIENFDKLLAGTEKNYTKPMLFAVGDGNHSLASAKMCYELSKEKGESSEFLRYALVEIVNIYDQGIEFEPIHRAIFSIDNELFIKELAKKTAGFTAEYNCCNGTGKFTVRLPDEPIKAVDFIESFITQFIKTNGGTVDYIHGEQELKKICANSGGIGIELRPMKKEDLFPYLINSGTLPKKTFSMGEAEDKRYYLEARKIK